MAGNHRPFRAGLIGVGEFGATFVAQSARVRDLDASVLCDRDPARAVAACAAAGISERDLRVCDDVRDAERALDAGATVVVGDPKLLIALPIDIVIEATGMPETGARNAVAALDGGRHVAMVTKETDSVVGPILSHRARANGLAYTAVDGDQPNLLIALIARMRALGFPVIAAGKSSEHDLVVDGAELRYRERVFARCDARRLWSPEHDLVALAEQRAAAVPELPRRTASDFCELAVVANATALMPDVPGLHAPIARSVELADLFAQSTRGGLLDRVGVVDVFTCLRRDDEASFAGGVFVIVGCPDRATGALLASKGLPVSADRERLMVHNPVHLLGLEAPASVLAACRGRADLGSPLPRCDVVAMAERPLAKGTVLRLGARHAIDGVAPRLVAAVPAFGDAPAPYYLAAGARLRTDVAAGETIRCTALEPVVDSTLWALRAEQDQLLLGAAPDRGPQHTPHRPA